MAVVDEVADEASQDALRQSLQRAQAQLAREKSRSEMLREAMAASIRDALAAAGPLPPIPGPPRDKRRKRAGEVALLHMTDWQGSKRTTSYDTQVMHRRVRRYLEVVDEIVEIQRADHPVRRACLAYGGDMVEGLFNFPTQPFEIDATLHEQWVTVGQLIAETVVWALSRFEWVDVVAEWGNHGRIGSKRATVPGSDNFDRMCYTLARKLVGDHPRLRWDDCPEDIQRIEIGEYRALLIHGDEVGRNGFASPMTIVRHADRWRSGAYPWPFRDVYMGHYHTHAEWPMANGEGAVYQTGSTESDNRYAGVSLAASATPSQRLHFVHPVKGRVTSQHKIYLD